MVDIVVYFKEELDELYDEASGNELTSYENVVEPVDVILKVPEYLF